tara:strand:+ start:2403 stop:2810 length:408 start_codon:yes stop_codon:yes gene_type:complete
MKREIKITSGIYFLYRGEKLVYVGSSQFCEKRVLHHLGLKDFTHFEIQEKEETGLELLKLETELIIKNFPEYNKSFPAKGEYVTLANFLSKFQNRNTRARNKKAIKENIPPAFLMSGRAYFEKNKIEEYLKNKKV